MKTEKETIREFSVELLNHIQHLNGEPDKIISGMIKSVESCNNLSQLKMVKRDMLEWTQDITGSELEKLDQRLSEKGLPTLTNMRIK